MNTNNPIVGKVKLQLDSGAIPTDGLTVLRHRVELVEKLKPDLGWISELIVLGDLPWHEGEERRVEVRIMTSKFRDHVIDARPSLLVKYGSKIIGALKLE